MVLSLDMLNTICVESSRRVPFLTELNGQLNAFKRCGPEKGLLCGSEKGRLGGSEEGLLGIQHLPQTTWVPGWWFGNSQSV